MKLSVAIPSGELYNEEIDSIVVSSKKYGEYGMLNSHLPIVSIIDYGYIKITKGELISYIAIIEGLVEQSLNDVKVIAEDAHIGVTRDSALEHLEIIRKQRIEENKKRNIDLALAERELKKQISNTKAGEL